MFDSLACRERRHLVNGKTSAHLVQNRQAKAIGHLILADNQTHFA